MRDNAAASNSSGILGLPVKMMFRMEIIRSKFTFKAFNNELLGRLVVELNHLKESQGLGQLLFCLLI